MWSIESTRSSWCVRPLCGLQRVGTLLEEPTTQKVPYCRCFLTSNPNHPHLGFARMIFNG